MDSVPGHVRGRYVPPRSTGRPTTANGRNKSPDPWLAGKAPVSTTALAISKDPSRVSRLSFGCPHLDDAFGGGVPVQGITEIAGEAGAGKTQLSLQLLLQAQLPRDRGGLGGKSYALSCGEGNFPSRRLRQMAERYQGDGMDAAKMMEGVCIQTARNLEEQLIILLRLGALMPDLADGTADETAGRQIHSCLRRCQPGHGSVQESRVHSRADQSARSIFIPRRW
ncbi:unnamed protein product, partial [Discosporangium mesarthrocarpum]